MTGDAGDPDSVADLAHQILDAGAECQQYHLEHPPPAREDPRVGIPSIIPAGWRIAYALLAVAWGVLHFRFIPTSQAPWLAGAIFGAAVVVAVGRVVWLLRRQRVSRPK